MRKLACIGLLLVLAGCGRRGQDIPDTVDVSGTVMLDGSPVEGVEVNFMTDNFAGFGKTDSQGHYTLIQGAVPGENKVSFTKIQPGDIALNPEAGIDEGQLQAMAQAEGGQSKVKLAKQIIPADYTGPATKIKFTVPEGGTDKADFKLTSK